MKKGGEWRRLVLVEVGNGDLHLSPGDSPHLRQGVLKKLECILTPEVSERQDRSHCERREQFVEHILSLSFPHSRHLLDSLGRSMRMSARFVFWPSLATVVFGFVAVAIYSLQKHFSNGSGREFS